ncbi:MAG: N-acetyltransferase [Sulfobacillus thermosulfidooxidans]|nr:MAG: N-acetyltransferase [Sulfobacillus thermosulfidooxidans]
MRSGGCLGYQLVELKERHCSTLYQWDLKESRRDLYTCRPVDPLPDLGAYSRRLMDRVRSQRHIIYCLTQGDEGILGKIEAFDLNPRNKSMEFGYYLPPAHRGHGVGTVMLRLFLREMFSNEALSLNKIYATTAEHNTASVRLLERFGFHLDGVLREHYWTTEGVEAQLHFSLLRAELSL